MRQRDETVPLTAWLRSFWVLPFFAVSLTVLLRVDDAITFLMLFVVFLPVLAEHSAIRFLPEDRWRVRYGWSLVIKAVAVVVLCSSFCMLGFGAVFAVEGLELYSRGYRSPLEWIVESLAAKFLPLVTVSVIYTVAVASVFKWRYCRPRWKQRWDARRCDRSGGCGSHLGRHRR